MGISFFRRLFLLALFAAISGSFSVALPQTYPYNIEILPQRGSMPTSDELSTDVDAIDVTSGKLGVEIPLAPLPAGHAGSSFSLKLIYDSHFYQLAPGSSPSGTLQYLVTPAAPGGRAPGTPGGWNYNYQVAGPRMFERYGASGTCKNNVEQRRRYIGWFVLPDGSAHVLHLSGYGDQRNDNYVGDGFYDLSMTGYSYCFAAQTVSAGTLTYFTADGTFLKFEIQANGANTAGPTSGQTWTLYYPDGRRITGNGSTATAFLDASGNRFRIENQYSGSVPYTSIRDDFDRVIRLDFDVTGAPVGRKRDRITSASPAGPASWTVDWETITLDADNAVPRYYVCRESDQRTCRLGIATGGSYTARELTVVKYVQLPEAPVGDDPPEWNSWAFRYSGDALGGFGELNYIRAPDGATYDYTYRLERTVPTSTQLLHRNGVASRRITHDGMTDLAWNFNYAVISDSDVTTRVTQPDGGQTLYHYANPTNLGRWDRGLVFRIEGPLGSVRKRVWARNLAYSIRGSNNTAPPNNPYVQKETATVGNSAGVAAKTAVAEYAVDKNGNLLSRKEYDWVPYSPSGTETGTSLLRQASLLYYVETPAASDVMSSNAATYANAYWDAHGSRTCGEPGQQQTVLLARLDAVRRQTVSDATTTKAVSEFNYDCAFTSGNRTAESRWDSRKSAAVPPVGGMTPANAVILRSAYTPAGDLGTIYAPAIATQYVYNGGSNGPYASGARFGAGEDISSHTYEWNVTSGTRSSDTDDQTGARTTYTYDLYGRLRTAVEAGLRTTDTTYDSLNRVTAVKRDRETPGDGQLQSATHRDQLGRVILVRSSDGAPLGDAGLDDGIKVSTRYIMAPGGARVVSSTPYRALGDPTLEWRCVQYDALGRVGLVAMFAGPVAPADCNVPANRTSLASTIYDADRIRFIDPAAKTRDEYRDALGRLVEVREDPNGLNYRTIYEYNVLDNLTRVTQFDGAASQVRSFVFSSLGRLLSATNPETGTIIYDYDDGGKLISRSDARSTVTFCYDALHRLEGKRYGQMCAGPETFDVYYTYYPNDVEPNNRGRLASVSSWEATNAFSDYTVFGQPQTNTQTIQTPDGETQFPLRFEYRLDGSASSLTYPSGKVVNYAADAAGRTTQVYSAETLYADMTADGIATPFTADGRLRQMKLGNGLWETRDYRTPVAPTRLQLGTQPGAGELLQLEYSYAQNTNNGNLVSQVIRRGPLTWAQSYTYDGVNRVSRAEEAGGWARTYGYDSFGNRWVATSAGLTLPDVHEPGSGSVYDRQTNRLNNAAYDSAGNQIRAPGNPLTFNYDAENRLINAESPANGNARFGYDGDGRRVWKSWTANGGQTQITYYVYGLNGEVLAEYGNQPPDPSTSGRTYVFADLLGSVRAITSDQPATGAAAVLECYDYLPFGRILNQTDNGRDYAGTCHPANPEYALPSADSQKFTGQPRDTEVQLDYFGARYYSTAQGRFISPDPLIASANLSRPQSWNRYAYVEGDPINNTDPSGLWTWRQAGTAAGYFVAGAAVGAALAAVVIVSAPVIASAGAAALVAAGVSAATATTVSAGVVTAGVGVVATVGLVDTGVSTYRAAKTGDWNTVAFNAGGVVGAMAVGAPGGRRLLNGLTDLITVRTTVYRVEGLPNTRIIIGEKGQVAIEGEEMLFLNFGDRARADEFLAKRLKQGMPGAQLKSFEVPQSFLNELKAIAVPESMARQFPGRPLIVDITKAGNQFGLRPEQIQALRQAIIQGSGKTQ